MYSSSLTKVIIALIIVLAVSVAGLVVVSTIQDKRNSSETEPEETSNIGDGTTDKEGNDTDETDDTGKVTDDSGTTVNGGSDPTTTTENGGSDPITTTDKKDNPDETTETPRQKAPNGYKFTKSYKSNSGSKYLNTRLEINGYANTDGTVHIVAELYLEHWSLFLAPRQCTISIGSETKSIASERISQEDNIKTSTLLTSFETDVFYGQSVTINAVFPFNGTYGKDETEIKNITISDTLLVK